MNKQEKIREGLTQMFCDLGIDDYDSAATEVLSYLYSQGVVIKVDGFELPAGYTAFEPLIGRSQ